MLMINKVETPDVITLKLEGRLVGPWVKELAFLWNSAVGLEQKSIRVDLSAVTYVDATGVELLTLISQGGARITATGSLEPTFGGRDFSRRQALRSNSRRSQTAEGQQNPVAG